MKACAIAAEIFRAYDIRGLVGAGLSPEVMELLGRSIGSEALDLGEPGLVVGADARLSSPAFHQAMIDGILATGCDVIDIGVVPTPLVYFATQVLDQASGVMITGSHNPKDYNGVKIVMQRQCLADNQVTRLRQRLLEGRLHAGAGSRSQRDLLPGYIDRVSAGIHLTRPWKVVLDCGNGVTATVAPRLFEALGCEVVPLYCEVDGNFPNHHPDPTVAANLRDLRAAVARHGADLGVAFDGDGDRVVLMSGSGRALNADMLLMCFLRDILPDQPGARVVFDVKSSSHLPRLVTEAGGEPVMCKSGHSFVKKKMVETGALLGGEFSSHIFFKHRWYGFDDGMYTAVRFLELMEKQGRDCDELMDDLPPSDSTGELFVPVSEARKFSLMARLGRDLRFSGASLNRLDGVRADFPHGWGLLRASNTTANLVLRFEADSPTELARIRAAFQGEIARLAPELDLSVLATGSMPRSDES